MAANTIAGIVMDIFKGVMLVPATGVQIIRRMGRDYDRTRTVGLQGRQSTISTIQVEAVDAAALVLVNSTYPNLAGTVITVIDSLDNTYTNVAVLGVTITAYKTVSHAGASKKMIAAEWTFLAGDQT